MATQRKIETTDALTQLLQDSKGTVVVDYRGLDVAAISTLRRRLREQSVELRVAKNTLLRRAAAACDMEGTEALFLGPSAIATCSVDEVAPARLLAEAARIPRTPLAIKGGIWALHGVSADQVRSIADLPSRDVMLARAVGVAQAPASAALSVVQAAARQILNAVSALQRQQEGAAG